MLKFIFVALTLVTLISVTYSTQFQDLNSEACGDWHPYKDEKCFKFIDKAVTFDDAVKTCREIDSTASLVTIRNQEEQNALWNYIFKTKKVSDDAWIGLKHSGWDKNQKPMFKWIDGTNYTYRNWVTGMPTNQSDGLCVKMESPDSFGEAISKGNWRNFRCNRRNVVVCQRLQTWSIGTLQNIILKLKDNPVPLGFIYVQIPGQPEPKTLWSIVGWEDITSEYAGLFFRAEGGGSEKFGTLQHENAPMRYVDTVRSCKHCSSWNGYVDDRVNLDGGWGSYLYSGSGDGDNYYNQFHVTEKTGEVRPMNKAVRIWKRIQ